MVLVADGETFAEAGFSVGKGRGVKGEIRRPKSEGRRRTEQHKRGPLVGLAETRNPRFESEVIGGGQAGLTLGVPLFNQNLLNLGSIGG